MELPSPTPFSQKNRASRESLSQSQQPLDIVFDNFIALIQRNKFIISIPVLLALTLALYFYFGKVTYTSKSTLVIQKADNSSLQAYLSIWEPQNHS